MTRQFDRTLRLTIHKPSGEEFFSQLAPITSIFGLTANGIAITQLRVQFNIEHTTKSTPNKCDIIITNLSETMRTEVARKPLVYTLEAGYDGVLQRIFSGDLRHATSEYAGATWETRVQCADGDRAFRFAPINKAYTEGVLLGTILADVAASMNLEIPRELAGADVMRQAYSSGYTASGKSRDELTRLLSPYGYEWSIQDGKLLVLRTDEVRAQRDAVISVANGMEGSPKWTTPEKKGASPTLQILNRLYPQLQVGQTVTVESRTANGRFKLLKVAHTGDTHGAEFSTKLECKPL